MKLVITCSSFSLSIYCETSKGQVQLYIYNILSVDGIICRNTVNELVFKQTGY